MAIGAAVGLICFEEVVDDVFWDPAEGDYEVHEFDRAISVWVASFRSPDVTKITTDLTALGSVSVIVTLFVTLASILITFRDVRRLVFLTCLLAGAGAWPALLKTYFGRARPGAAEHLVHVSDLSFPSGHSFGAAALYIGLAYCAGQYARTWPQELYFYILGGLLCALVGVTRIYLGVHYPTDVLAGLSGGVAWGLAASAVCEFLVPTRRQSTGPRRDAIDPSR